TNEEGVAIFAVSSQSAGKATYTASVVGINVGEISVEFLQDQGILKLGDNYPNPFRSQTILPVTVPRTMQVTVTVYNSLGVPVRTAIDEQLEPGYYEIPFNARELASGVYFYRLMTEEGLKTKKMVLVK
ncbi:MAG TPA: T9SS type A sorting domain-containing protein, partial [Saprospiraceae bacterium]|nr:T9SS type A sorting domain-containing protein [Saprospiraceae bacterium]